MSLAVVTGAPGWLGTPLVDALVSGAQFPALSAESSRVRCIVEPGVNVEPLLRHGSHVELVRADLRDARAVQPLCAGASVVFHAAGIIHPKRVRDLYEINVGGTRHMLEAAHRAGVRRFVHVSSNSPAGLNESPTRLLREDEPPRPYLSYGLSKLQAERLVGQAHRAGRVSTVIIRPCWFYGPHQPARQTRFFRMIRSGRPIVFGRGDNLRSMSYVDNVVQGLLLAAHREEAGGRTFWIADRRPYSFIEILETVASILGVRIRPLYLPRIGSDVARLADSLVQFCGRYNQEIHVAGELAASIAVSIDAAVRGLGYAPQVELDEGMRRSIEWCRQQGLDL